MTNNKARIYTLPDCPQCKQLKKEMDVHNIDYEEVPMDEPKHRTVLLSNEIFTTTAPVLQVGTYFWTSDEIFTEKGRLRSIFKDLKR